MFGIFKKLSEQQKAISEFLKKENWTFEDNSWTPQEKAWAALAPFKVQDEGTEGEAYQIIHNGAVEQVIFDATRNPLSLSLRCARYTDSSEINAPYTTGEPAVKTVTPDNLTDEALSAFDAFSAFETTVSEAFAIRMNRQHADPPAQSSSFLPHWLRKVLCGLVTWFSPKKATEWFPDLAQAQAQACDAEVNPCDANRTPKTDPFSFSDRSPDQDRIPSQGQEQKSRLLRRHSK